MKTRSLFGILCVSIATLTAHSGIVYVNGPSFPAGDIRDWRTRDVDIDNDGSVDFSFWSSGMLCTQDIPTSGCGWPFYIRTATTNEVLTSGNDVSPRSFGNWIASDALSEATWTTPGGFYGAGLSYWWYSLQGRMIGDQLVHSGWSEGIGDVGVGYLGVRFYASDGLHYGWVRARIPRGGIVGVGALQTDASTPLSVPLGVTPVVFEVMPVVLGVTPVVFEVMPVVIDWAYETQPNTAIRAGDIGTDSESVQFKVEFFDPSPRHRQPRPVEGAGSLILTDGKMRGELVLSGNFAEAELRGPANLRARTRPVLDFGLPLVSGTNHTAFFRETTLTRAQIIALAHGLIYVSVDDGDVVGRITPVEDDRRRRR